jgi:hypothetical protein
MRAVEGLETIECFGFVRGQTCLQRERMMHQGDQRSAGAQDRRSLGKNAKCQSVDDDGLSGRRSGEQRVRRRARPRAGTREAVTEIDHLRLPAERRELGNDAPVIGVAAGRRVQAAGHRK